MSSTPPSESVVPPALGDAWRADTASAAELRHGYARFVRQQVTSSFVPRVARWLVVGLVLGVGLAQAATIVRARWLGSRSLMVAPPQPAASSPASRPQTSPPEAPAEVVAEPPGAAMATSRADSMGAGPVRAAAPSTSAGAHYIQQQWQEAAVALRDHDFVRADSAFREIERSSPTSDREAARLARAQLLASSGRTGDALVLASELMQQAHSSLVRDKARDLVTRITKKDPGDRSSNPAAAIKTP